MFHPLADKKPVRYTSLTGGVPLSFAAKTVAMVLALFFIFSQILFLGSLAIRFIRDVISFLTGN